MAYQDPSQTVAQNQAYFDANPNIFGPQPTSPQGQVGSSPTPYAPPPAPYNPNTQPTPTPNTPNVPPPTDVSGGQYGNLVGSSQVPGQTQQQFYNTQTNQPFSTPQQLADFYNQQTGTSNATSQNVFDLLKSNPLNKSGTGNTPFGGTPGFNSANISATTPPNLYDLYQNELNARGVSTANQQLLGVNTQIAGLQPQISPLQASNFIIPQSLQSLQTGGATQGQINLAAQAQLAPIQTAMTQLLLQRSALSDYISGQSSLAQQAVTNVQTQYENALKSQGYQYEQIGQHIDAQGNVVPDYGLVNPFTGRIQPTQQANPDNLTNNQFNTGGFAGNINGLIGTRQVKGQTQQEFYNTQTGQGFSSPQDLANFYNQQTGTQSANSSNIFSLLASNNPPPQTGSGAGQGIDSVNSRTYRNSNPIAASVAVNGDGNPNMNDSTTAEWINALNRTNIPYSVEQGQNFSGNRATISFPTAQNGLDGAITLLGTSAFNWYKNHTGQDALAGITSPQDFTKLSYDRKVNIVKQIYSHEQPGGSLFSSNQAPAGESTSIQQQINSLPAPFQKSVVTSPSGYTFINTANMSDKAAQNVYYSLTKTPGITYLNPQNSQKETSLITGYKLINQAQDLVNSLNLPTDPYDPQRLVNVWNAQIGASPKLAQLNQMWQAAVNTLSGMGVTGLRSQILIEKAAQSDFPTGGSIKDVANAQLQGLTRLLQNEESATMGKPLTPDYSGWAQKALNSVHIQSNGAYENFYNTLNSGTTTASLLGQ